MTISSTSPSDPLSQASEFCAQTCSEDLLDYLGLSASCTAEEAQSAINQRIETLEQQPGKQEYAHELNNLMDGLENFLNLLSNPSAYFEAAVDGVVDIESAILTESLDLVFRKGLPGELEETSLRKSASEYGVSESTFDSLFKDKLTKHRGTLPAVNLAPAEKHFPAPVRTATRMSSRSLISSMADIISLWNCRPCALTGGFFIVTTAT